MTQNPIRWVVPCICILAGTCVALAAETRSLFDGKTLAGWEGDTSHWRVEEGSIVGEIPAGSRLNRNTWLVWRDGSLVDFDLRLQAKLGGAPSANSGIQFRCQVQDIDHVSGYQADLDQGATWLGRIYDEHGRALLVERGSRVLIKPDGVRTSETFAPAAQYAVLFRDGEWNDYRIVAKGEHIAVFVNGTLFGELIDSQRGERDLKGSLALQLHSGPETRVEFRNIELEVLDGSDDRMGEFRITAPTKSPEPEMGVVPGNEDGRPNNFGFELGSLAGWTATGDAFTGQPVNQNGISARWAGQTSGKQGDYFIGGYENVKDAGKGTLTSDAITVTHPFASFLIGGGDSELTRAEIILLDRLGEQERVIHRAVGNRREQMRRVSFDLRDQRDRQIRVRLVDQSGGGWGHLNFDDFRFHDEPPQDVVRPSEWRSTRNPLLQHLRPNPTDADGPAGTTLNEMFVPPGFEVDLIAGEPDLHQPMAFTFDGRGRLWVAEGHCYPQKRPPGEGLDRVLIFSDEDGDGSFETRKVFTEGLNLVSGMEVGHGGLWIGAAPHLLFIPDADGDDRPDGPAEVLLEGFGFADTHETLNSFLWGPDGWLYGNQGVFNSSRIGKPGSTEEHKQSLSAGVWRYHPTRHEFEVFAHGGSNQWGLDYDLHGQIFMTHCRSHWGRGPTTHVIQGAHYWNQVNAGHAPFVSPVGSVTQPLLRNFMLASSRYGHGEGGAGKPGTRLVYGGHSHVGTLIYLGDNWPVTYRNHLLTHNLHGHQINHQINLRSAGGYRTLHAGSDPFFCADRQYIGVDLKVGPDGAVYFSDWYDPRHCHSPNIEQWDRGNGRMYRMRFVDGYQPRDADYANAPDIELVNAQLQKNDWHVRAARLEMQQRANAGAFSNTAIQQLRDIARSHSRADRRLRAMWSLHVTESLDESNLLRLMTDPDEYVRAWAVQLSTETKASDSVENKLTRLAADDSSLLVLRYLASAIQRVTPDAGWRIASGLAVREELNRDTELTKLLWIGIASISEAPAEQEKDVQRLLALADETASPLLQDFIHWYAAKRSDAGRQALVEVLAKASQGETLHALGLLELATRGTRGIKAPSRWQTVSSELYESSDDRTRRAAESIGAMFGDQQLFAAMRKILSDTNSDVATKRYALSTLSHDGSAKNLPPLLELLDSDDLIGHVLPMLGRYDSAAVGEKVLTRISGWPEGQQRAAVAILASRREWAAALLDAVESGELPSSFLTAYDARQIYNLGDEVLRQKLSSLWGSLGSTSSARQREVRELVDAYDSAPLWAYSSSAGEQHFKKLCATCHQPQNNASLRLAPKLAGSGTKGVEYIVENIADPNAVIGRDYLARNILTVEGRVISGLIEHETDSAVTVRTSSDAVTISKEDIEEVRVSENSFMPEGILNQLNGREKLELLKYLMTL